MTDDEKDRALIDWARDEYARRTKAVEESTGRVDWIVPEYRITWSEICFKADELGMVRLKDPVAFRLWWHEATDGGKALTRRRRR